jgi:hypothetical protein
VGFCTANVVTHGPGFILTDTRVDDERDPADRQFEAEHVGVRVGGKVIGTDGTGIDHEIHVSVVVDVIARLWKGGFRLGLVLDDFGSVRPQFTSQARFSLY